MNTSQKILVSTMSFIKSGVFQTTRDKISIRGQLWYMNDSTFIWDGVKWYHSSHFNIPRVWN